MSVLMPITNACKIVTMRLGSLLNWGLLGPLLHNLSESILENINMCSLKELKRLYEYDKENGGLVRKVSVRGGARAGDSVGSISSGGYVNTTIKGVQHQVHRLVYLLVKGDLPEFLDHKDGNPANNRIENLRPCTNSQNQYNKKIQRNNTSGYKNVYRKGRSWIVLFRKNNRLKSYGTYKNIEEAVSVASTIRAEMHEDFARAF